MDSRPRVVRKPVPNRVRRIIGGFVPEGERLPRTTIPGHLQLLGKDLGVKKL